MGRKQEYQLICPEMPLIFPCQRHGLDSTAPFPINLAPGHGTVCALSNLLVLSTHLLESSIVFRVDIARAGLDNRLHVFTPLVLNKELARATEHCDSSTTPLSLLTLSLRVAGLL